ncbi:hypothetical protein [Psychrobacter sp. TWR1-1-1]|uniref:hypothetical protein n=1 Tax=Psychrobacter sp. TWR1-1-1 TaxID=2804665 RepID=UPI003CF3DBAA
MTRSFYNFSKRKLKLVDYKLSNVLKLHYKLSYSECSAYKECKNPVFRKLNSCALHCQDEEVEVKYIDRYLKEFCVFLMEYLIEKIRNDKFYTVSKAGSVLTDYPDSEFEYKNIIFNNELKERIGGISISVENIIFPKVSDLEDFIQNAKTIVRYLGKVNFKKCQFSFLYFNGPNNCYYENCTFNEELKIHPFPQMKNKENEDSIEYRYIDCNFEKNIYLSASIFTDEMKCNMFYHCFFNESIIVNNLKFKKTLLKFPDILQVIENKKLVDINFDGKKEFDRIKCCYKIKNLSIIDCSFESEFKLNGISKEYYQSVENAGYEIEKSIFHVNNLSIIDNKFKSKVEIKYRTVEKLIFNNSNVDKVFDTFQSVFIEAKFSKSIFNDFAGFEEVDFGVTGNEDNKEDKQFLTIFEHVTFLDFSSFRGANFRSGLDFSKTNLKDTPNFLNVDVSFTNTTRETFRIIKNSFDDVGNKLEANKFFAEEMAVYKKELDEDGDKWDRLVYRANEEISDFGRSYIKPSVLLFLSLIIYTSLLSIHESFFENYDYLLHPWVNCLSIQANEVAKNLLPFSKFLEKKSGIEFVSLLFYIWFGILIWQIVVAVKRHTQR